MRGIVHKFCRERNYNMTGNYDTSSAFGRKTNDNTRHAGTRPHFIYGHSSADFSRYADIPRESGSGGGGDELYVFMVRNPMSWMVSRHQHHLRKHDDARSFVKSVVEFGREYFVFLDPTNRNLSNAYFSRSVNHELSRSVTSDVIADGSLTGLVWDETPVGIAKSLEGLMFGRPKARVVVLVQDYYTESLAMLDHVFDTDHFSTSSSYRHNTAREGQDKGVALGTVEELLAVNRLLEVHQAVYHLCLEKFLRNYRNMLKLPGRQ